MELAASIRRWLRASGRMGSALQHCADLAHRLGLLVEPTAVEPGLAALVVQIEHQPHRRRLARAVRAEER